MKKIAMIVLALFCAMGCCNAQLVHTKGKMGVGIRGGVSTRLFSGLAVDYGWRGHDIGLFYHYYTSPQMGIVVELDREKMEFKHSDFKNSVLLGVGGEYAVWKPTKWMMMELSLLGNVGYDVWDCTIMDWREEHFVFGANGGFALEFYPWHFLSFMLKGRQFALFGRGDSYVKPDISLGVKVNW